VAGGEASVPTMFGGCVAYLGGGVGETLRHLPPPLRAPSRARAPKDEPPIRKHLEHLLNLTMLGGVRFLKALPGVSATLLSFWYGGVHAKRTRGLMPGSRQVVR